MIANISPSNESADHTLNTLRYADRVKELKGKGNNNFKVTKKNNLINDNNNRKDFINGNFNNKKKVNTEEFIGNLLKGNSSENNILTSKLNNKNNCNNVKENKSKIINTKTLNKSFYVNCNKENFNLSSENNYFSNISNVNNNNNKNENNSSLNILSNLSLNNFNKNNLNKTFNNNYENLTTCPNLPFKSKMTLPPHSNNLLNFNNDNKEEELKSLQDKHEKVLNELLLIEDLCVDKLTNNLIEIGQSLNQELQIIEKYKKGEINIKEYGKNMKKLIQNKINKLQSIVMNFDKFNVKVEEENQLSNNIEKLKDIIINEESQKAFSVYEQDNFEYNNNFNHYSIDEQNIMDLDSKNFN
jgi:kinesin family protein 2/24